MLCRWENLPDNMRTDAVKPYYNSLYKKRLSLVCKSFFDRFMALIMLICFLPIFVIISLFIYFDSPGPIFFKQNRITQYGKSFKIYKFRTMVVNAEKVGTLVTSENDKRITNIGNKLRKCRLDELPQLINVIKGEMSFVGTRPEVPKYVAQYSEEMLATLLLPAGITSVASIEYKDEDKLLSNSKDVDKTYINEVLPQKMVYNLDSVINYSFINDLKTMINTVIAVL